MGYRVVWHLYGRSERLLDGGCVDEVYDTYGAAVTGVSELLRTYPEVGRHEDGAYWWARRSADADIEMRVWVEDVLGAANPDAAAARVTG